MKTQSMTLAAIITLGLIAVVTGCASKNEAAMEKMDQVTANKSTVLIQEIKAQDSIQSQFISSSAAKENKKDTVHKFIRTAEMKFLTPNVFGATVAIEDLVAVNKGFVTYTNLKSFVNYRTVTPVSSDSLLETVHYTTENEMILRVPNYLLDTTLKQIARYIEFLDYRIIKATDVSLDLLGNAMKQKRLNNYMNRMQKNIDSKGVKLNQIDNSEENILNKAEQSDNTVLSNLKIKDEMEFSTVKLSIYEDQKMKRRLFENEKNIQSYESSFGAKVMDGLNYGWIILRSMLLFLIHIWPLTLTVIGLILYLRNKMNKK